MLDIDNDIMCLLRRKFGAKNLRELSSHIPAAAIFLLPVP